MDTSNSTIGKNSQAGYLYTLFWQQRGYFNNSRSVFGVGLFRLFSVRKSGLAPSILAPTFFFVFLAFNSASAQQTFVLGRAIDPITQKGIADATVVNKNTKQITKTSANGNFLVRATRGDSIKISSVGYRTVGIAWDGVNTEPLLEMKQEAIMLPEVVIKDRRLEIIRKQIDELLAAPEASTKLKWKDISNLINTNTSTPGGIGISIDGLYQLFSKEGKTRRKLEAMKQEDLRKLLVEYRYNPEYVSYVTKLKGQDLKDFMKFCNLPENFILTANDYDLTFEVFRCLDEFKSRMRF